MQSRHILIGLIALFTLPSVHAQRALAPSAYQIRSLQPLLTASRVGEEITALTVSEIGLAGGSRYLSVDLQGHVGTVGKLAAMNIQVWLLRADGSTAEQQQTFPCMDCFLAVPPTDSRQFRFAAIPIKELLGVAVNVNGTMYVREIKAS